MSIFMGFLLVAIGAIACIGAVLGVIFGVLSTKYRALSLKRCLVIGVVATGLMVAMELLGLVSAIMLFPVIVFFASPMVIFSLVTRAWLKSRDKSS